MSILSVSQLNMYIHSLIDGDNKLKSVFVRGEISNLKLHSFSGHIYFSLKDEKSLIKSVMFRTSASRLKFVPYDGLQVICTGSISVYEKDGNYQLYVNDMQPDGLGSAALSLEQLKQKLEKEGLFNKSHKRQLPLYPQKIAVITSGSGAAVQDVINIIGRRYPLCELLILSVSVQGAQAEKSIVNALKYVNNTDSDIVIVTRGGGSAEDLSVFNSEKVARAAYSCRIPLISAVGHQTDYTILDFVSDMRAPTPSAAAELATPDVNELMTVVDSYVRTMTVYVEKKVSDKQKTLERYCGYLKSKSLLKNTGYAMDRLLSKRKELITAFESYVNRSVIKYERLTVSLDRLSPLSVIGRGYTLAEKDGRTVSSVDNIDVGDTLKLILSDGFADCTVTETEKNNEGK